MSSALTTDLYHQDAAYVAWRTGRTGPATFDLYVRHAPFGGAYLLTAGLEAALAHATGFRYTDGDLRYLAQVRAYDPAFLDFLRALRFTGDVAAIPEGTIAFPHEPLLRVRAPFIEALLLEAGLIRTINLATLIATKAARIVTAAAGRPVAEFALRRAHAPYEVTRAAYIGGCATTSFVAAAKRFGLQPTGTIPHALVQLYDTEREAFEAVATTLPQYTLLLDTYDVHQATHTGRRGRPPGAAAARTRAGGRPPRTVATWQPTAATSRRVLDAGGLESVRIVASGDLDEFAIAELVAAKAPLDGFGIGTKVGQRRRLAPAPGCRRHPQRRLQARRIRGPRRVGKGQPQARRHQEQLAGGKPSTASAHYAYDVLQLASETPPPDAVSLLRRYSGRRVATGEPRPCPKSPPPQPPSSAPCRSSGGASPSSTPTQSASARACAPSAIIWSGQPKPAGQPDD